MLSPKTKVSRSKRIELIGNYLKLLAMALFLLLLFCVNYIKIFLMKCILLLDNPIFPARKVFDACDSKLKPRRDQPDDGDIMDWLRDQDDIFIELFREVIERKEEGIRAKQTSTDKRLYAVLSPTKEETLQRIENAIDCMDYARLRGFRQRMRKHFEVEYG